MRAILLLTLAGFLCSNLSLAKSDTLEIQFAEGGKLVIVSKDKNQFKTIANYDINKILRDIVDTVENSNSEVTYLVVNNEEGSEYLLEEENDKVFDVDINFGRRRKDRDNDDDYDDYINYRGQDKKYDKDRKRRWRKRRTTSGLNFDFGLNNYLENGEFPTGELYEVKPWGSWFFAINHIWTTPVTKTLNIEWGTGFNFYAFKLDNSDVQILEGDDQVEFVELPSDFNSIKSKLGTSYFNISVVPVFDFGRNRRSKFSWRRNSGDGFRIGVGGYAGYRLGGRSKLVFRENGDRERSRIRDSFFLENWRYGVRGQIGYRDVDFFINYDFNELFESGRGPELNAISFGIII